MQPCWAGAQPLRDCATRAGKSIGASKPAGVPRLPSPSAAFSICSMPSRALSIDIFLVLGLVLLLPSAVLGLLTRSKLATEADIVRGHRTAIIICAVLILILLAQYATWVVAAPFNESDDLQSYFVFPQKMLQTGQQGADPFSERRIIASLGGQWFLAAIGLAHAPEPFAHLIEPGVGVLLLLALICGSFRQWRSWLLVNTGLALLIFFQPPVANVSMLAIGTALFVALFRSVSWFANSSPAPLRNAFIVSLLSAALMTGKSTFVPPCGAFLVISYLWRFWKSENRKPIIAETILAGFFSFALMAPWMVSSYRSGHTLFYPFFGKGYHASRYGVYEPSWSAFANRGYLLRQIIAVLVSREVLTLGLLVAAAWIAGLLRFRQRNLLLPVILSIVAGMLTIFIGGGGCGAARYDFPFLFAAILVLLPEVITTARSNSLSPAAATTATALVCLAVGIWVGGESAFQIAQRIQSVGTALKMAHAGTPMNSDLRSQRWKTAMPKCSSTCRPAKR